MLIDYNDIVTRQGGWLARPTVQCGLYSLEKLYRTEWPGLCYQFTSMCNDWCYYYR